MRKFAITEIGAGRVTDRYTLTVPAADATTYHDAQIADYTLAERAFVHKPPLTLTVRAVFNTTDVHGTAGFGLWNHPFSPEMRGLPRLPQAAWFFYGSPPNNMSLAKHVPGHGWKCTTLDATRPGFLALLPLALPGFALMRVPPFYRTLWPIGQAAVGVSEHALDPTLMTDIHTYQLNWDKRGVAFAVDGVTVHESPYSPRGPLGFIAWVDNQYAVVTPQGRFGWGLVDVPSLQSLRVTKIDIE